MKAPDDRREGASGAVVPFSMSGAGAQEEVDSDGGEETQAGSSVLEAWQLCSMTAQPTQMVRTTGRPTNSLCRRPRGRGLQVELTMVFRRSCAALAAADRGGRGGVGEGDQPQKQQMAAICPLGGT